MHRIAAITSAAQSPAAQSAERPPRLRKKRPEPGAFTEIRGLSADGQRVVIDVRYGGGSRTHDFGLAWSGAMTRSIPPQATLVVEHDDHADPGRALLDATLKFDVSPLFESFNGPIAVRVGDKTVTVAPPGPPTERATEREIDAWHDVGLQCPRSQRAPCRWVTPPAAHARAR